MYSSNTIISQSDYLRRISQKMLSMDKKPQHSGGSGQINPSIKQNPVDPGMYC